MINDIEMDVNKLLKEINSCIDCKDCMEVCDTYKVTNDELKSPNGRLKITEKVFSNSQITEEEIFGLYTCTLCGLCDLTCQQEIQISEIIHSSKVKLVEENKAPLEIHNKIIRGIVEKDNSVGGHRHTHPHCGAAGYKGPVVGIRPVSGGSSHPIAKTLVRHGHCFGTSQRQIVGVIAIAVLGLDSEPVCGLGREARCAGLCGVDGAGGIHTGPAVPGGDLHDIGGVTRIVVGSPFNCNRAYPHHGEGGGRRRRSPRGEPRADRTDHDVRAAAGAADPRNHRPQPEDDPRRQRDLWPRPPLGGPHRHGDPTPAARYRHPLHHPTERRHHARSRELGCRHRLRDDADPRG